MKKSFTINLLINNFGRFRKNSGKNFHLKTIEKKNKNVYKKIPEKILSKNKSLQIFTG